MLTIHRSSCLNFCIAAALICPAVTVVGQAAPAAAPDAACAQLPDTAIPVNTTLAVKVTGLMSSGHLKPGKSFWMKAATGVVYPSCTLEADAPVYGHVTAASSSKNPDASELAIQFDAVDCTGHSKQPMKLSIIGVIAAGDDSARMHDAAPTEVHGGGRSASGAAAASNGLDAKLNPGGPPNTIKPGAVVGLKNVKLEPQGGPSCSAKFSSTNKNIELAPDTILLLAVQQ
jgi:hypothetical protein